MPYSISHAVVALPFSVLTKRVLPIPALSVGAISPDFSYFLTLTTTDVPSHSVSGVFIYCLVPSLLLLMLWHRYLETPTLELFHLPHSLSTVNVRNMLYSVLAILIGAFSHVLWDASSHSYGALVKEYQFLNNEIGGLPLYKWNQYLSGVLGLLILGLWYVCSVYKNRTKRYMGNLRLGMGLYVGFISMFVVLSNALHGSQQLSEYAVRSSIGFVTGIVFAAIIYAINYHFRRTRT